MRKSICKEQTVFEKIVITPPLRHPGEKMARQKIITMDQTEEDLIHSLSLKCLKDTGVCVHSKKVLKLLEENGAVVDYETMIAKLSQNMVNGAIKKAPSQFTLCARDPKNDLSLPVDGPPHCTTSGLAVNILDMKTGEARKATQHDLVDYIKLADALEGVAYVWTSLTLSDVPDLSHGAHELWTALGNTTKHVTSVAVRNAEDAKIQIELAALVSGGKKKLKERPVFSVICCSLSPLLFEEGAVEALVEFARAGVPIVSIVSSICGVTAPVTMAGAIINNNAENLASLVITQAASPGAPFIYATESTPMDVQTAGINYQAPEVAFIANSASQMARRYQLPCETGFSGLSDGSPGIPWSICESITGPLSLMGTDLAGGMGSLDDAMTNSCEQLVIDAFFWDCYRSYLRQYEISEETAAMDVVKEVGHGNSFLTHPHTFNNFKQEFTLWDKKKLAMQMTRSDSMVKEAGIIARDLILNHKVPELDPKILKKGTDILSAYDRQVCSG
jgi:trimethylamine--corrinoid protein Co-methyltransferase